MKKLIIMTSLCAFMAMGAPLCAHAQDTTLAPAMTPSMGSVDNSSKAAMEKFRNMSPEEKAQFQEKMRAQIKEKMDSLSPEEKAALKDKAKSQFESMTPEQKEQIKAKIKEHLKDLSPEQRQKIQDALQNRADTGAGETNKSKLMERFQKFRQSHNAAQDGK